MTLYHTEAAPYVPEGPKAKKLLTSHKQTSWEHDYVRLAQVSPEIFLWLW